MPESTADTTEGITRWMRGQLVVRRFLGTIASVLKPGGRFILESGILPELQSERRLRIGDLDFFSRNTYNAAEG